MTPAQCRAARKMLGWTIEELAFRALCSTASISNVERSIRPTEQGIRISIRRAFTEAGVDVETLETTP